MADLKHPTYVNDPKNQPTADGQPINIRPGSRLAVLGVFVSVIRQRFDAAKMDAQFPYGWKANIKETKLAVESAFNEDKEHKGFRPAIYIDVDDQIMGRVVIGDRVGKNVKQGVEGFWNLSNTPILIECVSAKRAESAILGDLVGTFIHASSDLIQAKFGFHDLTPVTIGRTQPSVRDKNEWTTPVTFVTQYPMRWTNTKTGPLLQELELQIERSGLDDATTFFELVATGESSS